MSLEVRLDANARRDFDRHVAYFESVDELQGRIDDLEDDLLDTLATIGEHPFVLREIYPNVRHASLRVFRYHVWYRTYEGVDFLDVIAILHHAIDRREVVARLH